MQQWCTSCKLHITIDLVGNVIHFSGLHLGTTPDSIIWKRTENEHPTERNEFGYGDLAYKGCLGPRPGG